MLQRNDTVIKQIGGEVFIWLTLPHGYSSPNEVYTGTQTGHDPGGRSEDRSYGEELLTGLLLMVCSAHLLQKQLPRVSTIQHGLGPFLLIIN